MWQRPRGLQIFGAALVHEARVSSSMLERIPVTLNHFPESWPGSSPSKTGVNALMSRPSTPCSLKLSTKDLDARDKRGHDGGGVIRPHRNVL